MSFDEVTIIRALMEQSQKLLEQQQRFAEQLAAMQERLDGSRTGFEQQGSATGVEATQVSGALSFKGSNTRVAQQSSVNGIEATQVSGMSSREVLSVGQQSSVYGNEANRMSGVSSRKAPSYQGKGDESLKDQNEAQSQQLPSKSVSESASTQKAKGLQPAADSSMLNAHDQSWSSGVKESPKSSGQPIRQGQELPSWRDWDRGNGASAVGVSVSHERGMLSPRGQELPTWKSNGVKQSSDYLMLSPHGQESPMWQSNGVKESPDSLIERLHVEDCNRWRTTNTCGDYEDVESTEWSGTHSDEGGQQEELEEYADVDVASDFESYATVADELESVVDYNPLTEPGGVMRSVREALMKIGSAKDVMLKAMTSGYVGEVFWRQDSLVCLRPPPRPPDRIMVI